jgi:hypothetical protein
MISEYYIDSDMRKNKIYIAKSTKSKIGPFLIECSNMGEAQDLVRKLNAKLVSSPEEKLKEFSLVEEIVEALGTVKVFKKIK